MKQNIATTPNQSKRLLASGVDPQSADMLLYNNALTVQVRGLGKIPDCATPAWSLSALIALMPRQINDFDLETYLVISPSLYSKGWIIEYVDGDVSDTLHSLRGFSLIEGCVLMIEWLTANGYKLNEI